MGLYLQIHNLANLVGAMASLWIAIILLGQRPRTRVNIEGVALFFALALAMLFDYFAIQIETPDLVLWLSRLSAVPGAVASAAFIHLIVNFPEGKALTRAQMLFLAPFYVAAAVVIASFASPLLMAGVRPLASGELWVDTGPIYLVFALLSALSLTIGSALLFGKLRRAREPSARAQLKIMLAGSLAVWLSTFTIFLHGLGLEFIPPVTGFALSAWAGCVAYAIIQHGAMDVRKIVKRSLVYSILTGVVAGFYLIVVLTMQNLLSSLYDYDTPALFAVFLATIVAIFQPLADRVQRLVDLLFAHREYQYREVVASFSRAAGDAQDEREVANSLAQAVVDNLGVSGAALFGDDEANPFLLAFAKADADPDDKQHAIPGVKAARPDSDGAVFPLAVGERTLGELVVSTKVSGEELADLDRELVGTLVSQAAAAIDRLREEAELRELSRLKREFIAVASHEMRTPLAIAKGNVQLVRDEVLGPLSGDQAEKLASAEGHIDALAELVNDLLDLSRLEVMEVPLALELLDLDELVTQLALERDITVGATSGLPLVQGDPLLMGSAISKLMNAAIQRLDHGALHCVIDAATPGLVTLKLAPRVGRETGEDPSPRSPSASGGRRQTGARVALAIASRIAEAHGGRVIEDETPGREGITLLMPSAYTK